MVLTHTESSPNIPPSIPLTVCDDDPLSSYTTKTVGAVGGGSPVVEQQSARRS